MAISRYARPRFRRMRAGSSSTSPAATGTLPGRAHSKARSAWTLASRSFDEFPSSREVFLIVNPTGRPLLKAFVLVSAFGAGLGYPASPPLSPPETLSRAPPSTTEARAGDPSAPRGIEPSTSRIAFDVVSNRAGSAAASARVAAEAAESSSEEASSSEKGPSASPRAFDDGVFRLAPETSAPAGARLSRLSSFSLPPRRGDALARGRESRSKTPNGSARLTRGGRADETDARGERGERAETADPGLPVSLRASPPTEAEGDAGVDARRDGEAVVEFVEAVEAAEAATASAARPPTEGRPRGRGGPTPGLFVDARGDAERPFSIGGRPSVE